MTVYQLIRQRLDAIRKENNILSPIEILNEILIKQDKIDELISACGYLGLNNITEEIIKENLQNYITELRRVEGISEGIFRDTSDMNGYVLSRGEETNTCWGLYYNHLINQNRSQDDLNRIVDECNIIVQQYLPQPAQKSNRKGLIIGQVQSGKTTIFNGIISAAADMGFNIIIVLSGTIESLRKQTQKRIVNDITEPWNRSNNSQFAFTWISNHDGPGLAVAGNASTTLPRLTNENNKQIAIGVFLKNNDVLNNLKRFLNTINVLHQDKIRALIIDDEADQATPNAGVNRNTVTAINNGIKSLINVDNNRSCIIQGNSCYLGFTATPFANLLNEAGENTLYPKDFIYFLKSSTRYFGPRQLFGNIEEVEDEETISPLNIIRYLNDEDINGTVPIRGRNYNPRITNGLSNSIKWFLLSAAMRRVENQNSWTTMLIHTSSNTKPHEKLFSIIKDYILELELDWENNQNEWYNYWLEEKNKNKIEDFSNSFPNYGTPEPQNYPEWFEICQKINSVFEDVKVKIDNSLYQGSDRLSYLDDAPLSDRIQIAIGGNTLSRGLTLEGLVSSYFARSTSSYDALLQMGRWFGFRQGYELLPRIWTTVNLANAFQELVIIENNLRNAMDIYLHGHSPANKAPIITRMPSMALTRKSVIGNVSEVNADYSGSAPQTIIFNNELNWLRHNYEKTIELIEHINQNNIEVDRNKLIYRKVTLNIIKKYLSEIHLWQNTNTFNKRHMIDFINNNQDKYSEWTVVVYGGNSENYFHNTNLKMNNRSRVFNAGEDIHNSDIYPTLINVKSLRSTTDLVCDVLNYTPAQGAKEYELWDYRKINNLDPVLIIYPIDKNSTYRGNRNSNRTSLGAYENIIGLSLIMNPPNAQSSAIGVQLDINDVYTNEENSDENPDLIN